MRWAYLLPGAKTAERNVRGTAVLFGTTQEAEALLELGKASERISAVRRGKSTRGLLSAQEAERRERAATRTQAHVRRRAAQKDAADRRHRKGMFVRIEAAAEAAKAKRVSNALSLVRNVVLNAGVGAQERMASLGAALSEAAEAGLPRDQPDCKRATLM